MKHRKIFIAILMLTIVGIVGVLFMQRSRGHLVQMLAIPSYFAPGSDWTRLSEAAAGVGVVIINPSSGPGPARDPGYAMQVEQSKAHGAAVLGYVATGHGQRDVSDAVREIDAYYAWYQVDGIFFDQASTDCTSLPFYARLQTEVKARGGKMLTVLNPGMMTNECFMNVADIVVTFENTYRAYTTKYQASKWIGKYNANRFWHLIYDAPTATEMRSAVNLAKDRKAKWVYVTSASMPNPWSALPEDTYWQAELNAIK